ncbi:NAD(P)-dependent alcohol dehydrogenase [Francisella sp. SYW-9]|uniref:NAD(P)-dependent alcohol dehydrogenase n=1 Tax=Francisella sp. SYW-9 TaxID=2610888 RepID=UPI00123DA112|nr:NAD(P)-dependent alcohol dehydrogenase [Francisella sp. SYW-9]
MKVKAYGVELANEKLKPVNIQRRDLSKNDVEIDILYCGVCHSDIHITRDEWLFHKSIFPMVPGHEIIGKITNIGNNVDNFKIGDYVGVGCMVDSCRTCNPCNQGLEQYCEKGFIATYSSEYPKHNEITQGGYSEKIVVDKDFVLKVPKNLDLAGAAPLLCAGITTYSPLAHLQVKPNDKVGVIGLGGLGHMGIKIAKAMGAEVTMITTSESKAQDGLKLGADKVLISRNKEDIGKHSSYFDVLLNTIPVEHDLNPYLQLLSIDGTMSMVGSFNANDPILGANLIFNRRSINGSLMGGIKETQEMLDFCGKHNITADIETIDIKDINKAFDRMLKNDVKYRFVIDMKSLKQSTNPSNIDI